MPIQRQPTLAPSTGPTIPPRQILLPHDHIVKGPSIVNAGTRHPTSPTTAISASTEMVSWEPKVPNYLPWPPGNPWNKREVTMRKLLRLSRPTLTLT